MVSSIDVCIEHICKSISPYCSVDATEDNGSVGRMINHSKKSANLVPRLIDIKGTPHICFFSKTVINRGKELLYDYGDRSQSATDAQPWLQL